MPYCTRYPLSDLYDGGRACHGWPLLMPKELQLLQAVDALVLTKRLNLEDLWRCYRGSGTTMMLQEPKKN